MDAKQVDVLIKNVIMKETKFLIVDLFCGAGGTTTGFHMTNGIAKVIACVRAMAMFFKLNEMVEEKMTA